MINIDINTLQQEIKKLNSMPAQAIDEAYAREVLQSFFDYSLTQIADIDLKPAFLLINKLERDDSGIVMRINLKKLIENLTFCFDLIYAEKEKRILFISDSNESYTCAKPEKISLSFLNILYNVVELCNGAYFFVSLSSFYDRALIKIECDAQTGCDISSLLNNEKYNYINSIGGCILSLYENGIEKTVISLPIDYSDNLKEYEVPNVEDLLFDRLSVIYTSLF